MTKFYKYSATGNDFVLIEGEVDLDWERICHRKFGVGADGVLFYLPSDEHAFKMRYLNADGREVSMCGNGARSMLYHAHHIKKLTPTLNFETCSAVYKGSVDGKQVKIEMSENRDAQLIQPSWFKDFSRAYYVNTGVPHCVLEVSDLEDIDVSKVGKKYAHDQLFAEGCNINFFELEAEKCVKIRTFERGVEAETLACGTGVTAAALACQKFFGWTDRIDFQTRGGDLFIELPQLILGGEVDLVYTGELC